MADASLGSRSSHRCCAWKRRISCHAAADEYSSISWYKKSFSWAYLAFLRSVPSQGEGNLSQGGPWAVWVLRDTHLRHPFKGSCLGSDKPSWRTRAPAHPAKTHFWSHQKPRDFTASLPVLSHQLSLMHILISHLSNQAIQITGFIRGNAWHVFWFQEEKNSSWAYFQCFKDILILQWSKNRNGLINTVQFHSCADRLIYVLVSLCFLFLNSWLVWASWKNKNYFESSITRKLMTNQPPPDRAVIILETA